MGNVALRRRRLQCGKCCFKMMKSVRLQYKECCLKTVESVGFQYAKCCFKTAKSVGLQYGKYSFQMVKIVGFWYGKYFIHTVNVDLRNSESLDSKTSFSKLLSEFLGRDFQLFSIPGFFCTGYLCNGQSYLVTLTAAFQRLFDHSVYT